MASPKLKNINELLYHVEYVWEQEKIPVDPVSIEIPYTLEEMLIESGAPVVPDILPIYQMFPDVWMRRHLDVQTWKKQTEIVRAVARHPLTSVRSAHDLGKSFGASCLVHWHFQCFPDSKTVTTAPTERQVKKVIWGDVGKLWRTLRQNVGDPGELLLTELRDQNNTGHWAAGYTTNNPDAFQGIHETHYLLIFDEAAGIPDEIYGAARGTLTSEGNRGLLIGNPTEPNTFFHRTHTGQQPGYYRVKMSAFDSPNIGINEKGEYYTIRPLPYPKLVTLAWVNDTIKAYGRNDPYTVARVFGEFPDASEDQLIDNRMLASALKKGLYLRKMLKKAQEGEQIINSAELRELSEQFNYGI